LARRLARIISIMSVVAQTAAIAMTGFMKRMCVFTFPRWCYSANADAVDQCDGYPRRLVAKRLLTTSPGA
jgi:hypothetical protein